MTELSILEHIEEVWLVKLVIVESPTKVQTIRGYLGDGYHVMSSVGHVRDLPTPSALPKEMKSGPYGKFAVDVDDGFKPYYQVNPDKKKTVTELRKALKEADELYLATDEDREGEAIAWHLQEVLKPKVPVKRMVFHEITKNAIQDALENTREIDRDMVDAQETRRVLDRLYGYEVSPVLWRKVAPSLSAGRVQSVATRLVVDRERERMAHVSAEYWSVDTTVAASDGETFTAKLVALGERSIAGSSDFKASGELKTKSTAALILKEDTAGQVVDALVNSTGRVAAVTQKPYRRRPAAPFTTSTLQQEASRKLKWNASTTMRVAQTLYEGGYITYMRTDSTNLSSQALDAARRAVSDQFGQSAVHPEPRVYGKKAKGAQEAHEAIRPSGEKFRSPDQLSGALSAQQLALYSLIYKRTLATQMNDAVGYTATVRLELPLSKEVEGESLAIATTSGTVITDPGFQRLYREGSDKNGGEKKAKPTTDEAELPQVAEGDSVTVADVQAESHFTQPPGRYTEATLVKAMEELGIGRPSTYAATIQTIGDRGYVTHRGQYLVPTWLAFSVTRLLTENLPELVDYQFTADMESDLDRIAAGQEAGVDWLKQFYFGSGDAQGDVESGESKMEQYGLRGTVENLGDIDAREVNSIPVAPGIVLRNGRYGPYLQTEDERRISVPPNIAPDEMTPELAQELLEVANADGRELGVYPTTGNMLIVKTGRYGPYVTEILPEGSDAKPKTASLFSDMTVMDVTLDDAIQLLSLPRVVGKDPESGEEITAQNGPYGPYLKKARDTRQLPDERSLLTVTLDEALEMYSKPKFGRGANSAKKALREFGEDPVTQKPVVVKDGRFGPYVTDGVTNATIPRTESVESLTAERAYTLLADKRDKAPAPKRGSRPTTPKRTTARTVPARAKKK